MNYYKLKDYESEFGILESDASLKEIESYIDLTKEKMDDYNIDDFLSELKKANIIFKWIPNIKIESLSF